MFENKHKTCFLDFHPFSSVWVPLSLISKVVENVFWANSWNWVPFAAKLTITDEQGFVDSSLTSQFKPNLSPHESVVSLSLDIMRVYCNWHKLPCSFNPLHTVWNVHSRPKFHFWNVSEVRISFPSLDLMWQIYVNEYN